MSARDAAHSLASLQRLFNQTNLLVVTPSAPTFSAQDLDLHSPHDLKARLKVTSSNQPQNLARRSPPEGDRFYEVRGFALVEETDGANNEEKEPDARYLWARP
jgi:hypothetical protein